MAGDAEPLAIEQAAAEAEQLAMEQAAADAEQLTLERCCRQQQQVVRLHSKVAQLAAIQAKRATAAERSEQLAIEQLEQATAEKSSCD